MYKAAMRFGIPCLAVQACEKFRKRIRGSITTAEVLEAVEEAYTEAEWVLNETKDCVGLKKMQHALVRNVKGRWPAVKNQSDFENVVLLRPEFGRDLMRLL
jgi:hypothetical protein